MRKVTTVIVVGLIFVLVTGVDSILRGSSKNCSNIGEPVHVDLISEDPCISCSCINGTVECSKEECGSTDGCHLILYPKPADACCDVCKGCNFKGHSYRSGQSFTDPSNSCLEYTCEAGVISISEKICNTICKTPTKHPDECCPRCNNNCRMNGITFEDGKQFRPFQDKCVTCECQNGEVSCAKKACPIPNCPVQNQVSAGDGCCQKCKGSRTVFSLGSHCLFGAKVHREGSDFKPDSCSACKCQGGTTVCTRMTCSVLECADEDVESIPGECCSKCRSKKDCIENESPVQHGHIWDVGKCIHCRCDDGEILCGRPECEKLNCDENQHEEILNGQCCPRCVDNDGVCTVFGDPHYQTYDGKMFDFQGTCKYILTKTCHGSEFQVQVRNHARLTENFTWLKMATVYLNDTRIDLRQRLEIKVNKRRIQMPFTIKDTFTIANHGHSAMIKTPNGIQVTWDGDSYLEIIVPQHYRNKMCGLCGNYDGNKDNDFKGKTGDKLANPKAFGDGWRYGSKKACQINKNKLTTSPCITSFSRKLLAYHECSVIYSAAFSICKDTVDPKPYYRFCVADVCDCPAQQQCSCEALHAYERACQLRGIRIESWKTARLCAAPKCPIGANYEECGTGCPVTCENFLTEQECNLPCVAGCHCPKGTALYHNRCIKTSKCPRRLLKKKNT